MGTATGIIRALNSGIKHLAIKRFTLRYPEEKLKFVGDGYQFDPSTGVGIAGLKGRHMLFHDHCTGCQLCSIACEGVAEAIAMVKVPEEQKQNKKSIMPQIDYGKCVFCGLCVDACPFYALYMTNDYELSSLSLSATSNGTMLKTAGMVTTTPFSLQGIQAKSSSVASIKKASSLSSAPLMICKSLPQNSKPGLTSMETAILAEPFNPLNSPITVPINGTALIST